MAGDAPAAVEAFDGAGGQSDVELASDQRVRDGVVVPVHLDVAVHGRTGQLGGPRPSPSSSRRSAATCRRPPDGSARDGLIRTKPAGADTAGRFLARRENGPTWSTGREVHHQARRLSVPGRRRGRPKE